MALKRGATAHGLLHLCVGLCVVLMLISPTPAVGEPGRTPQKSPSASETSDKSKEGRAQLAELEKKAEQTSCWKQAVASLRESCAEMDDRSQGVLSLALTNCHLQQYGRTTYPCPTTPNSQLSECTRDMDVEAFNALSTFTAHTSNICFFLAAQLWQERTERTVDALASTSASVVGQLNESLRQNEDLLRMQEHSLGNQNVMLESGSKLQESLSQARREAEAARKEAEAQADVWRQNFGELFRVLASAERWLTMIGMDWMTVRTLVFYTVLVILSGYVTTAPQTSAARVWLVCICVLGFAAEYLSMCMAVWWTQGPVDCLQEVNSWIRRIAVLAGVIAFACTVLRFRDPVALNTEWLERIERRIDSVQSLLEKGAEPSGGNRPTPTGYSPVPMNSPELSSWLPPPASRNSTMPPGRGFSPGLSPHPQATGGTSPRLESTSPPYRPLVSPSYMSGYDAVDGGAPSRELATRPKPASRAEDSGVGGEESFSVGPALAEEAADMRSRNPDETGSSTRTSHASGRSKAPRKVKRTPRKKETCATPTSQTYFLRSSTPKTS